MIHVSALLYILLELFQKSATCEARTHDLQIDYETDALPTAPRRQPHASTPFSVQVTVCALQGDNGHLLVQVPNLFRQFWIVSVVDLELQSHQTAQGHDFLSLTKLIWFSCSTATHVI